MATRFVLVATVELNLLFQIVLCGNAFRVLPANSDNACGADLYDRVELSHHYLLLTALAAAVLLLAVKAGVRAAEAAAKAGAHSRRLAAEAGALSRRLPAEDGAFPRRLAADHEGIGSVAAGWKRRSLRGMLHLAVVLCFAASVLAVVTFENGILYRLGCHADHAGYGAGAPAGVLVMGISALAHGSFAWTAITHN